MNHMDVNGQGPTIRDPGSVQEEGRALRDRLALQFERMDEELENPNLTPGQRYAIASPLIGLSE